MCQHFYFTFIKDNNREELTIGNIEQLMELYKKYEIEFPKKIIDIYTSDIFVGDKSTIDEIGEECLCHIGDSLGTDDLTKLMSNVLGDFKFSRKRFFNKYYLYNTIIDCEYDDFGKIENSTLRINELDGNLILHKIILTEVIKNKKVFLYNHF